VDGNSAQATFPNLAGQHAAYTTKQLANFKPQDGKAAERANAIMAGIVASMSADDMKNLGAYFENQKPQLRAARDPKLVQQGQAIYRGGVAARGVAACTGCHGPTGTGIPAQFPRLAGQYPEYTAAQLKAFRSGERGNDPNRMMRAIAERLSAARSPHWPITSRDCGRRPGTTRSSTSGCEAREGFLRCSQRPLQFRHPVRGGYESCFVGRRAQIDPRREHGVEKPVERIAVATA
jgi:cytochrome c553